ncbi:phage replisome organizer N-terminal domain-containing protein [Clostridium sp. SHJSY1]|uniref:phage replisome organizer N-terminal domain-containing protein n=1 Tax=Clostridium sp. SHJSY1 TaxID=2942483 RepID=UPI0028760111|nr:phage replisome organizer N-terminal domain-containing protein [Clostridium sp. SHJSY1]MDS0527423.1 phage replisome organizer N-terminal domain-containing protein [Clostridium sp. SHJSY1]
MKNLGDVKWIKLNLNMYDDEKMKLIDAMPEKDTIHYVWSRLLVQAGKINDHGYIYLSKGNPYTEEMLSIIFSRTVEAIKIALSTLKSYGMIQFDEKNIIKITNWEKHQNVEGMEKAREQSRKRMQKYREKKKAEEDNIESLEDNTSIMGEELTVAEGDVTVTMQKENKKKNKNKELEIESDNNSLTLHEVKKEKIKAENLQKQASKILSFYENVTGKVGIFSPNALVVAIDSYGESYVKMAIDKALEVDKPNMSYINGILKNLAKSRDSKGGISHGKCYTSDGGEFKNFKPKKTRGLSEEERKLAESKLI